MDLLCRLFRPNTEGCSHGQWQSPERLLSAKDTAENGREASHPAFQLALVQVAPLLLAGQEAGKDSDPLPKIF